MKLFKRLLPLLILIAIMIIVYATGLWKHLSFESLKAHRQTLKQLVHDHFFLMTIGYCLIYAVSTALSIPGGALLSIFGGFLFPLPLSTFLVVCGATLGATAIFLIAKTALGDALKRKAGKLLNKMQKGFEKNPVSYLLFLRFIPLFPFWLVNIAPAFFGVRLWTYIWTTFVGIIPGAYVFTQAGRGLGAIFDEGKSFSLDAVFNLQVKIALTALAIFSLIPIFVKHLIKKRKEKSDR